MLSILDDDEHNEYDAEDYDETDYDELDYEEDDNDSESLLHYWNNKSNKRRNKMTKHYNNTGCCCIALLVPILIIVFVITVFAFSIKSYSYSNYDPVKEAYKGGEPDYADGDLEDKLGDSGYYYDLFPEERDEEDDDSSYSYTSKSNNRNFELTDDFIKNMKDIDTRIYRFEFPNGTTGHGTRSEYERIMREKYTYGAVKIGDKYYYKNFDGTYKTGWHQENNKWYYFDLNTSALVMNELREINGKVYYLKSNGQMAQNEIVEIAGFLIKTDENGSCELVQ